MIRMFIGPMLFASFCAHGQYAISEFQVGYGTHIGGHLETKNSGTNGFEAADFKAASGWFVGYTHFINANLSVGISYNDTKGTLEQEDSFQSNPPPDFSGTWWSASAIGVHIMAGTSRFKPITVYGVVRYTLRTLESEAFEDLFNNASGNRIQANATTLGVGINWNISRTVAITAIEFSVGQGSSDVGKYDGALLQIGTLRTGLNIRIMKK